MDEQELDLRGFLGVLRRRRRLILCITLLCAICSLVLLLLITPRYTASTKLVLNISPNDFLESSSLPPTNGLLNALLDSEVELIGAEPVLLAVFDELRLLETDEFGIGPRFFEWIARVFNTRSFVVPDEQTLRTEAFERFQSRVGIEREAQTFVIAVRAQSESPSRAAEIANAIAATHMAFKDERKRQEAADAQLRLNARIDFARAAIERTELRLQTLFLRNANAIAQQTGDRELALINDQLAELQTENERQNELISHLATSPSTNNWPQLSSDQLSSGFQNMLTEWRNSGRERIDAKLELLAKNEIAALQNQSQENQRRIKALALDLRLRVLELELPASILGELHEIRTEAQVARDQYELLVAQAASLRARTELQSSDVRIISPARAPTQKSYPDMRLVALAILLGLGGAVALALVLDQHYGGISSEGQLEAVLSHPVVVTVPTYHSPNGRAGGVTVQTAVDLDPASGFAETMRRIRSEIELSIHSGAREDAAGEGKVILISSAIAGEGKSTVAVALARTLANSRAKTLIIDGDFRQPTIHSYIGREAKSGLIDFLNDTSQTPRLSSSFEHDVAPNLDALLGEPNLGVPPETLLSGRGFAELFAPLRKHYAYIIVDAPPILPVVDVSYLLRQVDGLVFVTAFGRAEPRDVRKAKRIIDKNLKANAPIFPVLNRDEAGAGYKSIY